LTTFTQLNTRLKNFLRGWLLVLGLQEGLVECATLCVKSWVILKSLSEALLFAEHGENMLCTKIVLNVRNNFCTQHVLSRFELGIFMYYACNSMNNLPSYCGLADAKIRASDKDLPLLAFFLPCNCPTENLMCF